MALKVCLTQLGFLAVISVEGNFELCSFCSPAIQDLHEETISLICCLAEMGHNLCHSRFKHLMPTKFRTSQDRSPRGFASQTLHTQVSRQ